MTTCQQNIDIFTFIYLSETKYYSVNRCCKTLPIQLTAIELTSLERD